MWYVEFAAFSRGACKFVLNAGSRLCFLSLLLTVASECQQSLLRRPGQKISGFGATS